MSVGKTIGLIKSNLKTKISWRKTPFGGITRTISWCRRWGSPIPDPGGSQHSQKVSNYGKVHCTGNQIFKSHQKPVDREWKSEVLGKNIESQDCQIFPSIFVADRGVLLRGSEDDREWNISTPSVSHANKWSAATHHKQPGLHKIITSSWENSVSARTTQWIPHSLKNIISLQWLEYKLRRKCTNG